MIGLENMKPEIGDLVEIIGTSDTIGRVINGNSRKVIEESHLGKVGIVISFSKGRYNTKSWYGVFLSAEEPKIALYEEEIRLV